MHTQKAAFDDVTLAYQVLGDDRQATPLLMIMGLTGVKEDWAELPRQLHRFHGNPGIHRYHMEERQRF